jgi:3-hydroxyisobutyrate dehydrogenase-like beta-hydroxyacid dehydrogenase
VGLDLEQVLDLCVNAAGSSIMLKQYGPEFIKALRAGAESKLWTATENEVSLDEVTAKLQTAVDEARRIKVPVLLGAQALEVFRGALQPATSKLSINALMNVWANASQ